jgi:predicted fused transcriptional regulator/phosphomethylpyrimidine kinase
MLIQLSLLERVREAQQQDRLIQEVRKRIANGRPREFSIDESDVVRFRGRLCVPQKSEVKMNILREGHETPTPFILVRPRCIEISSRTFGGKG